ncbi:immunity 70 family protein [Soonwooa sp.]|uniref:immunity 70 family protein n=1 Tax=Soonwooa sp. TaxID=1938592 RepID=UPI0026073A35|nr:immunity 70 family protein [Soonwooa sp.]
MAGLRTNTSFYEIGSGSFLHCFFSNIAYHLENQKWGSRFPTIMHDLYYKKLNPEQLENAKNELKTIQEEFKNFAPSTVIWDIEDLTKRPPWGDNIASHITDLSNYFWTSDGQNLFDVFNKALNDAIESNSDLMIS